ncbi:4Fe-4S dicluster domain-containing protein [Desulfobacula sp.]|uniref:4Fe-4S dicluster domain-containing protein n=1 Tax=Desulfobacula sp. TaxID=2593537 RepID=UPI002638B2FB|nr:4Fe-4S dicluster domain-containing protein [Desulfobacula sp.]
MTGILTVINWTILIGTSLFFLILSLSSFNEKEYRAAVIALLAFILNNLFWTWFLYASYALQTINILIISGLGLFGLISLMSFFPNKPTGRDLSNADQYDERDNMFARNNIQHYPDLMERYYAIRPENESTDRQLHQKPEFGEKEQIYHDAYTAPCYEAAFEYLEKSIPLSTGAVAKQKISIDPIQFCKTITDISKFYGACDVGFLQLRSHHFYSHKGRHAANWGKKTDQTHKTAIAIVVPMRVEMIKKGPTSCVLQESAQKYVEAAKISNILATYIRQFGYRARAHNDANYDTLCVPIAVEAGLGELGRMGILMHRVHGPCVRLAIVTTDLELPDSACPKPLYMEEFCKMCKKCADNCPSGSITHDNEPYSRNFRHWSIHQEKCFSYWKTIGSDCGFCLSVCPYTKPDTLIHKFVRFYISRNFLNQKIALFMDDLLYGRHKKIAKTNPENIFKT